MTVQVTCCPYGQPALDTLRQAIVTAKGNDPLAPVTVVVSRGNVALGVRRAMAANPSGVCNVTFVPLSGLADTIAQGTLAGQGRRPLTDAVLREAVSTALSSDAGERLSGNRDHPSTVDALMRTYRELRTADDAALSELAQRSTRSAEVVAVLRAVRHRTAQWFDQVDLMDAAADIVTRSAELPDLIGTLVVYLPSTVPPPAARLLLSMAEVVPCTVIIGVTGDERADELAQSMVSSLRPGRLDLTDATAQVGDRVLSAPSSDAEVLMVLRDVMARAEAGTPLERITIAHGGSDQYVNLLHHALRGARIPFNGGGVRPLAATVAGRMLLGVLRLGEQNWRRDDVVQWMHTGPIVDGRDAIPSARWDVLVTEAGIVEGIDEWTSVLAARAGVLRHRVQFASGDDDGNIELLRETWLEEASQSASVAAFVSTIAERLSAAPDRWDTWAPWAVRLLRDLVGGSGAYEDWPVDERIAAAAVEEAIMRLPDLDQLNAACSVFSARKALEAELAAPAPQSTRFGSGVWVTPVSGLVGLTTDILYVVGMHDGAFPARPGDDVLIPDKERQDVAGGTLPLRAMGSASARRDYLAALAGAQLRVLSYPRGNQRDGREFRPSRWVLDALEPMVEPTRRLFSRDIATLPPLSQFHQEPSFMSIVRLPGPTVDLADRDLRSLLSWISSGRSLADHPLCAEDVRLERGIDMAAGRRGFTRFNGNVEHVVERADLLRPVYSATRLEGFSQCPRQYFLDSVLRVRPRPVAERAVDVDRMELGLLLHRILERFVAPVVGMAPGVEMDRHLGTDQLLAIAEEEFDAFAKDGLTGPATSWRAERIRLLRSLRAFGAKEREWRSEAGLRTQGVEQTFGDESHQPAVVPGPVPVLFHGKIDRTDVTATGRTVVTDYKTGSPTKYQGLAKDRFLGGTAVQLAVYGLAVGASTDTPVDAAYWCVSERGGLERYGYSITPEVIDELAELIDILVEGLGNGHFPAVPGEEGNARHRQCEWCPYDDVCPTDRQHSWEDVRRDPSLSRYAAVVGSA